MKLGIIIQARMGSSRLPGKILKLLGGTSVLGCLISRLNNLKSAPEIIVATTTLPNDDIIVDFCEKEKVKYYRGDEKDVLSRYYYAAKENHFSDIVRITSDCPLLDIELLNEMIEQYKDIRCDYFSNIKNRTYPRGFDVEIFSFKALEKAFSESVKLYEREHVTPYIIENPQIFDIKSRESKENYSHLRITVDTIEDYELIKEICKKNNNDLLSIDYNFIKAIYKSSPELFEINKNIRQKGMKS